MDGIEESIVQQVVTNGAIEESMEQERAKSYVSTQEIEYKIFNDNSYDYTTVTMTVPLKNEISSEIVEPGIVNIEPILHSRNTEHLHENMEYHTGSDHDHEQSIVHVDRKTQVKEIVPDQDETLVQPLVIIPKEDHWMNALDISGNEQTPIIAIYNVPSFENSSSYVFPQFFNQPSHVQNNEHCYIKHEVNGVDDQMIIHKVNSNMQCQLCGKLKSGKGSLVKHIMKKHKSDDVRCIECDAVLPETGGQNIHHHFNNSHALAKCCVCNKTVSWSHMKNHMKEHIGNFYGLKTYKCALCDYVSASTEQFKIHMMGVHVISDDRPLRCPLCSLRGRPPKITPPEMFTHIEKHHIDQTPYKCPLCPCEMHGKSQYQNHVLSHKTVKCLVCKEYTTQYSDSNSFEWEMHVKNCGTLLLCPLCQSALYSEETLKAHLEKCIHNKSIQSYKQDKIKRTLPKKTKCPKESGIVPGKYLCTLCNELFESAERRTQHTLRVHTAKRNWMCIVCGTNIQNDKLAVKHIEMHMTMRCSICNLGDIATCDELLQHITLNHSTTTKCTQCDQIHDNIKSLANHIVQHGPKRKCPTCQKYYKFTFSDDAQYFRSNHIFKHTLTLTPLQCCFCEYQANKKELFTLHLKSHMRQSRGYRVNSVSSTYDCQLCTAGFATMLQLCKHTLERHADRKARCAFCSVQVNSKELAKHLISAHTCIKCPLCEETFGSNYAESQLDFLHHLVTHIPSVQCPLCSSDFDDDSICRHITTEHASKDSNVCPICNFSCYEDNENGDLKSHLRDEHFKSSSTCPICKLPSVRNNSTHLAKHRIYTCRICNEQNASGVYAIQGVESFFVKHMSIHQALCKDIVSECPFCRKPFPSEEELGIHLPSHLKEPSKIKHVAVRPQSPVAHPKPAFVDESERYLGVNNNNNTTSELANLLNMPDPGLKTRKKETSYNVDENENLIIRDSTAECRVMLGKVDPAEYACLYCGRLFVKLETEKEKVCNKCKTF